MDLDISGGTFKRILLDSRETLKSIDLMNISLQAVELLPSSTSFPNLLILRFISVSSSTYNFFSNVSSPTFRRLHFEFLPHFLHNDFQGSFSCLTKLLESCQSSLHQLTFSCGTLELPATLPLDISFEFLELESLSFGKFKGNERSHDSPARWFSKFNHPMLTHLGTNKPLKKEFLKNSPKLAVT